MSLPRGGASHDPQGPAIHVVGAGMAGLAAAVALSERPGLRIVLWEATGRAGGRCWSFDDTRLGRRLDNGNHLILSGNRALLDHADRIGAGHLLQVQPEAAFPFADLSTGRRWTVRIPARLRDALADPGLPGGRARIAADTLRLLAARPGASVAAALPGRGAAWHGFWAPMTLAILNAPPERAAARLMGAVLRRTVLRGGGACRPVLAPEGLGTALVEPAVACLARRGVEMHWRSPLTGMAGEGRVTALDFGGTRVAIGPRDAVILASGGALAAARPGVEQPRPGLAILNAHYRVAPDLAAALPPLLGLVGGAAHWIFRRGDVVSVTVSAAEEAAVDALPREAALERLWRDVAQAAGRPGAAPEAARLLRERHATWDQAPDGPGRRPGLRIGPANLALAGDHVRGPLPATLEGAVASGQAAARALLDRGGGIG